MGFVDHDVVEQAAENEVSENAAEGDEAACAGLDERVHLAGMGEHGADVFESAAQRPPLFVIELEEIVDLLIIQLVDQIERVVHSNSPRSTVTAFPDSSTRSPDIRTTT